MQKVIGRNLTKNTTFLVQAGTFLCFQPGRSSATRSSVSDITVVIYLFLNRFNC